MNEFRGKVAVVTGAASGIGQAVAQRCAQEGMRVVLADVDAAGLAQLEAALKDGRAEAISVRADVSKREDVQALADKTLAAFGKVHLLFNNAGVGAGRAAWETSWNDWEWVLGVNLWGPINGVKVFTPIMLEQNEPAHIVNTASMAGLLAYHPAAPYQVTKHAVVALSEHMYFALASRNAPVKVSVLCPYWVQTRIMESERNRPPELANPPVAPTPEEIQMYFFMLKAIAEGVPPDEVADTVFEAIHEERFYVVVPDDDDMRRRIEDRLQGVRDGKAPAFTP
ncbi:MAG: SDR family NAD(P)-dependent oxidoreductase [Anaerolineae bacterium]